MNEEFATQQLLILEHLSRVIKKEQCLFNSVRLRQDLICECNQTFWNHNCTSKLKMLYQLNAILEASNLSERSLYQVNEKLSVLLSSSTQELENSVVDGQILMIALFEMLMNVCRTIIKDTRKSKLRESLQSSILDCVQSHFVKPYVVSLWNYAKDEL